MHSWSIEEAIWGRPSSAEPERNRALRIDQSKQDLLNAVDLLGDVLDANTTAVEKRRSAIALVAGLAPHTSFGVGMQHLLLVTLGARQQSDDSCFLRIDAARSGVAGRLARELLTLRDRIFAGISPSLLDFVDMACLVRCMCLARKHGWMSW